MSQNDTIKKSDKKFIRSEKSRIRRQFLDIKKQEEMINELYKKFIKSEGATPVVEVAKPASAKSSGVAKTVEKPKAKKEKLVKKSK